MSQGLGGKADINLINKYSEIICGPQQVFADSNITYTQTLP